MSRRYGANKRFMQGGTLIIISVGTGSVLDAIRIGVPVIVVPNSTLLDNHQVEFAEVMAKMDYVAYGNLE
jgi:beta-1,4-N-acetylglucosaminyltransferase